EAPQRAEPAGVPRGGFWLRFRVRLGGGPSLTSKAAQAPRRGQGWGVVGGPLGAVLDATAAGDGQRDQDEQGGFHRVGPFLDRWAASRTSSLASATSRRSLARVQ